MIGLPIGIVVAVVVVVGWALAGGWTFPYEGPTRGCGGCPPPRGVSFAIGEPTEQADGAHHWYNFTVVSAGGGITLNDVQFQVVTATGGPIPAGAGWTLSVLGATDVLVGSYSFASGTWTEGGTTLIENGQTIVIDSLSTSLSAQGDVLNVVGAGPYEGSISVSIP